MSDTATTRRRKQAKDEQAEPETVLIELQLNYAGLGTRGELLSVPHTDFVQMLLEQGHAAKLNPDDVVGEPRRAVLVSLTPQPEDDEQQDDEQQDEAQTGDGTRAS